MVKIRVYFMEITDLNNQKHQIKSDDYKKVSNFLRRHGGKIKGINKGSRLISEKKFKEIGAEEWFR